MGKEKSRLLKDDNVAYLKTDEECSSFIPLPKMQDQSLDDQPYEKAKRFGIESLTESQLLAIILRTGLPGRPITKICKDIMEDCVGQFRRLAHLNHEELLEYDGVGEVKAMQIRAVMEIVRRFNSERTTTEEPLTSAGAVASMMMAKIGTEPIEHIYVLYLSQSLRLIQLARISSGLVNRSLFDVKPVIRKALMLNSNNIMLCHNHPSGNMRPSVDDDNITRSLSEACKLFSIRLLDHVIVGGGSNDSPEYYSYHDNNRLT